jgi:hypothetical protein
MLPDRYGTVPGVVWTTEEKQTYQMRDIIGEEILTQRNASF